MALCPGTRFTCPSAELDGNVKSSFSARVGHLCLRADEWISKSGVQRIVVSVSTYLWIINLKEIGGHKNMSYV